MKIIYAVKTTDNENSASIKAYFIHRENAVAWLSKNYDWYKTTPCEPDDYHLIPIHLEDGED